MATYYVDSVSGSDSNAGTSTGSAWKTTSKVNSSMGVYLAGDSILFKRGSTFTDPLIINTNGSIGSVITFDAYGTGANPIVTGFTKVTSWTSLGGGIYESPALTVDSLVTVVTINGVQHNMGRYPAISASNGGYLTIDSIGTGTVHTAATLPASFNGGRIVARTQHWVADNSVITGQSGSTITYSPAMANSPKVGFGFYIENHPSTLASFGDWYYNPSTNKIRIYFGSDPSAFVVNVSTKDILITIQSEYNTFNNLSFTGAAKYGISAQTTKHNNIVSNCSFSFIGSDGINYSNSLGAIIDTCNFSYCGYAGVNMGYLNSHPIIKNSTFANMGIYGISSTTAATIINNFIQSVGYAGINWGGILGNLIQYNRVDTFCTKFDDGGGIYTIVNGNIAADNLVDSNIVTNGIGNNYGTNQTGPALAHGIYMDNSSKGFTLSNNTVAGCANSAIFIHGCKNFNLTNNTLYNCGVCQLFFQYDSAVTQTTGANVSGNILFSNIGQLAILINSISSTDDINGMGIFDNNIYCKPSSELAIIKYVFNAGANNHTYSLSGWKAAYPTQDVHSSITPTGYIESIPEIYYNYTSLSLNQALSGTYKDMAGNSYTSNVSLPAYGSKLVIKTALPVTPPTGDTGPLTGQFGMTLPIYFNDDVISQLPVFENMVISSELMGKNEIQAEIELPGVLACPIGAYIIYKEQRYTVNTIPSVTKSANNSFKYTIIFESDLYRLYDKLLKHLNNKTFQYYGDLSDYCQLIVDNINQIDEGWAVGICDDIPEKTIDFDKQTCRTALDAVASAFTVEWYLVGKTINFVKQAGSLTTLNFKYGRGNGLYNLGYEYQDDENIVTRAFGYGSTRNLPENYRDGATQLMFDGLYLEENVDIYRVKEGDYEDEDIYPNIVGNVSAVSTYDPTSGVFSITDSTLTFNLKDNFSSETPKVSFLTGELQGQEFEIADYDDATKTITIKVFVDSSNNTLPSSVFQAHIGDTYTLLDMFMPTEVVAAAEDLLKSKTQEWLDENCIPRVLYTLELDPLYARDNNILLKPGDQITVVDESLGINELIRVTSISYPVNFPEVITTASKITAQIANFIPYTSTERIIADGIDNQKEIKVVNRTNSEKARLNALNLRTLQGRIFNPDGTLFDGPESLIAGMAAFGYDSQNFNLNNVTINPNAGADPNSMIISGGDLVHRIYKITGLGYIWIMDPNSWTGLDPAKFYYVYAKCSKTALTGTWEISETPVGVGDIVGYYVFNLGILYEVNTDGYREFEFTKGMTYIVGDTITTGRIQDLTTQNYFDLSSGQFNLGDLDTGIDWDVTTPATLTIRGAVASKIIQVGSDSVINAGISGITDEGDSSIRFWAGNTAANKDIADFRVQDDGQVFATRVKLGYASDGVSAGWDCTPDGIISDPKGDETENFALIRGSSENKEFSFGTELIPASSGGIVSQVGRLVNKRVSTDPLTPTKNIGLSIEVSGADNNVALDVVSGIIKFTEPLVSNDQPGITGSFDYERNGDGYNLKFENGILISQSSLP